MKLKQLRRHCQATGVTVEVEQKNVEKLCLPGERWRPPDAIGVGVTAAGVIKHVTHAVQLQQRFALNNRWRPGEDREKESGGQRKKARWQ